MQVCIKCVRISILHAVTKEDTVPLGQNIFPGFLENKNYVNIIVIDNFMAYGH